MIINTRSLFPVMGIDPYSRGFGYAIFETRLSLIDWGMCQIDKRNTGEHCRKRFRHFIDLFHPRILVMEKWNAPFCRRCRRVKKLLSLIHKMCNEEGIKCIRIPRFKVYESFRGSALKTNKWRITKQLIEKFPELRFKEPPFRMPWMSEDPRTSIFDACALALTYFKRITNKYNDDSKDNQDTGN